MKNLLKSIPIVLMLAIATPVFAADTGVKADATVVAPTSSPATTADAAVDEKKGEEVKNTGTVKDVKPAELPWWKVGLQHAFELIFLILGIMATALVRVMMKKYGFEEQSGKVNDVLMKAVGFAEQWSLKKMKLAGEPQPGGAKKMEMAIDFAKKLATEYKLPDKGSDWWEHKLEGWLGVEKAKAAANKG